MGKVVVMSKNEASARIKALLAKLEKTSEENKKKNIRATLRRLGHFGGAHVEKIFCAKGEAAKLIKATTTK